VSSVEKYDVTAGSYDELYREEQFLKYDYVFKVKGFKPGRVVLDIGCGTGLLIEYLIMNKLDVFEKYICVDPSRSMLWILKSKGIRDHRILLVNGYGEYIPLRDNVIDSIFVFTTWNNIDDKNALVEEIKRLIKPGGYVIVSTIGKADDIEPHIIEPGFKYIGEFIDRFYVMYT